MLVYWGANGGAVIVDYGIWTLLPIVVVVAVALKSRRALEPLILGTLLTYIIVDGLSFPIGWMDAFFRVATESHQWVFMVCGLFGALIALLGASHGTLGFSRLLGRLCRGPRTTLIVTWVMGILIFVDDYLNIMTLSTCMRKLTDRQKVPRETLSYIIDSTGAPVCALLPFSTWAVFFAGLFYAEAGIPELGYGSAINTFCAVIPFVFYAIAAVALVPLFSLGLVPKLGRMKKAYRRVEETGKVYSPESAELNLEDEDDSPAITGCLWDFVLPIGTLIALTIVGGELFLALVAFCFSMTVGVLWEFFEFTADQVMHTDMQKDYVVHEVNSVSLNPDGLNVPVHVQIESVIVNGEDWTEQLGGYLDIGLIDTMKDLQVNCIGAIAFSIIGFFYVKHRGKGKLAAALIPVVLDPEKK